MHSNVAYAKVNTSGKVKGRAGHWITLGNYPGLSDIDGMLKDGRHFAIEVKQPKKKPTAEQQEFIDLVNSYGGVAGVATDVNEALRIIESQPEEGL